MARVRPGSPVQALAAALLCAWAAACSSVAQGVSPGFTTERYVVRPLRVEDAELDYEAVMASRAYLRELFGGDWPPEDFTLEQNRADLIQHQDDFDSGRSYTYTVTNPAGDRALGCLYILPDDEEPERTAAVLLWTRPDFTDHGLAGRVVDWLRTDWTFEVVSVR